MSAAVETYTRERAGTESDEKRFNTLRAAFALRGYALHRSDFSDGPVVLYLSRWGLVRELASFDAADQALIQIGGAA